jgi:hypothetical protein
MPDKKIPHRILIWVANVRKTLLIFKMSDTFVELIDEDRGWKNNY